MMSHVDWEKWRHMKSVPLWEAIALAHCLEPKDASIKCAYTSDFSGNQTPNYNCKEGFNDPNLQRTLEIAKSYINTPDCFQIYNTSEFYPLETTIDLTSFGHWFLRQGWSLPEGFPQSQLGDNKDWINIRLPYLPTGLAILHDALRSAFHNKVSDSAGLRELVELETKNKGCKFSGEAIKQSAILIRPDDASAKDGRNNRLNGSPKLDV